MSGWIARAATAALLLAAGAAGADDAPPAAPLLRTPIEITAAWAQLPQDGTWAAGAGCAFHGRVATLTIATDAVRLRDPRPGASDASMVLFAGFLGRRIAGDDAASLSAELGGTMFLMVIGDVGVGAPGFGAGLAWEWRVARGVALIARTRATVPIPLADTSVAVRLSLGPASAFAGWRDVRFVPLLGLPGRYSSGPQVGVALAL